MTIYEELNLTPVESMALVNKFRKNRFGNVSLSLVGKLIAKGLVDQKSLRLTEDGVAKVEMLQRLS